ncbi:tyrosine-type recombinase/integrase [Acidithiobacillus caldus]
MVDRIKLTKRAVDAIPLQPRGQPPKFYRDSELRGFGLKVTERSKVFIAERRVNGKVRRVTIGTYGAWTPDNARAKAQQLLAEMAQGEVPTDKKRQERVRGVTLREAFQQYIQVRELTPKTIREYQRGVDLYLADWADQPLATITRDRVMERFRSLAEEKGAATANSVMRSLRAIVQFAIQHYGSPERPLLRENPVLILSHTRAWKRVPRRQGCLRPADLGPWMAAVQELANGTLRDYLLFLLFTGLRREEAASLTWEQVDLGNRMVTITKTKNHDQLELPLPEFLVDLLRRRHQEAGQAGSPFVFSSSGTKGYVQEPRKALEAVAAKTGIRVTVHDLRSTFITIADSLDISAYALKRLVNHRTDRGDVTAGYIVSGVERLREPMERIASEILRCVHEYGTSGVVSGRPAGEPG